MWLYSLPWPRQSVGERLVAAAHYKVLEEIASRSSAGWFGVFEDDAIVEIDARRFARQVPPDAKVVHLYPHGIPNRSRFGGSCRLRTNFTGFVRFFCVTCECYGAVAYAVTPASARELLAYFPLDRPVDLAYWSNLGGGLYPGGFRTPPAAGVYLSRRAAAGRAELLAKKNAH